MQLVDLTHPITPDMPVYPGAEPPTITTVCSIDATGFLEKRITFPSHTGTHIDAPAHLIKGDKTLDMLAIEHYYGPALQLDFTEMAGKSIDIDHLKPFQEKIKGADFLLFHTGWNKYWGSKQYFTNYPVLTLKAAHWLSSLDLKGIGLDTVSADPADSQDYLVHKALLAKDIVIIENLTNLASISCKQFHFSCFPLSLADGDGSPVRAVAFLLSDGNC